MTKQLKTFSNSLIVIGLFFLIIQPAIAQKYIVQSTRLNIRSSANEKSEIIGKLAKGDTVNAIKDEDKWIAISFSGKDGFVNKEFLNKIPDTIKPEKKDEKGFKAGFLLAFFKAFPFVYLVFAGYNYLRTKEVKDARFKEGYRVIPFTNLEMIKFAIYTIIVCAIYSFFYGIINIF